MTNSIWHKVNFGVTAVWRVNLVFERNFTIRGELRIEMVHNAHSEISLVKSKLSHSSPHVYNLYYKQRPRLHCGGREGCYDKERSCLHYCQIPSWCSSIVGRQEWIYIFQISTSFREMGQCSLWDERRPVLASTGGCCVLRLLEILRRFFKTFWSYQVSGEGFS